MQEEVKNVNIVCLINSFVKELADDASLPINVIRNKRIAYKLENAIIPYLDLAKKWVAFGDEHRALICYLKARAFYHSYCNNINNYQR
ncbi:MAG: hypothetical protein HUJ83_08970 [Veillonella sp.]|nr:hypothetical protein [Veillonella sp.]